MAKENIKIDLTNCEKMIMKVIWDEEGDCELQHLINELRDRYGKNYARTTVGTFLKKLINEGYVSTHRVGRASYSHAEISEADYLEYLMNKENHFWFAGSQSKMLDALVRAEAVSDDEMSKMKEILNSAN